MTNVFNPPNYPVRKPSLFLAGAIDMGNAVDWQAYVIHQLDGYYVDIFNPRKPDFDPKFIKQQINWELDRLAEVDCILMWYPGKSLAPISLLETGLYADSKKIIVGAEDDYYRRTNLEITSTHFGFPLYNNLENTIDAVKFFLTLTNK